MDFNFYNLFFTTMKTQNEKILTYLKAGRKLTPLQALNKFGCFRLSARIHDLREEHPIGRKMIAVNDKHVAQYYYEKK
jgi:hypothetical protein